MKKLVWRLVGVTLVGGLTAALAVKAEEQQAARMKSLIVYYSYTGKTELVAKTLAEILKADVLKIEDAEKRAAKLKQNAECQAKLLKAGIRLLYEEGSIWGEMVRMVPALRTKLTIIAASMSEIPITANTKPRRSARNVSRPFRLGRGMPSFIPDVPAIRARPANGSP